MGTALRTYVFVDLSGYGALLGTDDAAAARLLRTYRRLVRRQLPAPPAVSLVEMYGDEFHITFRSPGQAVRTAVEIVRACEAYNARPATTTAVRVHIGIDAGEAVRQGKEFVGSAVASAQRLSEAARPSQILVSGTVHELLRSANLTPMRDLGMWGPQGFGERVHVYEATVPGLAPPPVEEQSPRRLLLAVLFTDIVRSTAMTVELGDHEWARLVGRHHAAVRDQLRIWDGAEVDTAGDGFFATFDSPSQAIGCALAIQHALRTIGVEIRAGIHVGECELVAGKVGGISVVIGARVREAAAPGEILISQTTRDVIAGTGVAVTARGARALKGVPGRWKVYSVTAEG